MGNIVLLDDLTINKIAAGEVIERPASVVKELVENSIDAGATNITVEIKNGGISYIRITDNGKGFQPDDMEIAFERHATSKIRSADDLITVKSMGFRGEALASIAAIARVELKSKTENNDIGYKIVVEGGDILEKQEEGCPKGTTITVENLFFNTPVRYKFLKKDFTEAGYIEDVMTRIALVNPNIAIKLISSGKTIIQTSGNGDMKGVVYNIYGKEIAENILDVNYEYDDIKVTGVIGKPAISRSNRANQIFFVNKRYIKDKTLTGAAEQGFKGMITIGKFGFLILNLEVNPEKVDVNVHPAKLEVRFEEESKVFKAVYHSIKDTLLKGDLVHDTEKEYDNNINLQKKEFTNLNENTSKFNTNSIGTGLFQRILNKNKEKENEVENNNVIEQLYKIRNNIDSNDDSKKEETQVIDYTKFQTTPEEMEKTQRIDFSDLFNGNKIVDYKNDEIIEEKKPEDIQENKEQLENETEQKQEENSNTQQEEVNFEELKNTIQNLNSVQMEKGNGFDEMYSSVFGTLPKQEVKIEEEQEEYTLEEAKPTTGENISIFAEKEEYQIPTYKFIGIAFNTYIIVELDKEMYIIDQHAAHERIMYEKVKENYYRDGEKDSQLMLLPDIINLTNKEMDIARDNMEMFEKAGFMLEEFGENTIKLTGVPNICLELDTKELFLETLDEINTVARTAKQEIEEKFIATVACKAAVKANMALSKEEVESLMNKLLTLPNPFTCPHGRPTAIKMTKTDIEKKFSRR